MDSTAWGVVIVGFAVILLGFVLVFWLLTKIREAVATANGILLGGLADRQEASNIDKIPEGERTRSQQAYVDRRDSDDRATRTKEARAEFDKGDQSDGAGR